VEDGVYTKSHVQTARLVEGRGAFTVGNDAFAFLARAVRFANIFDGAQCVRSVGAARSVSTVAEKTLVGIVLEAKFASMEEIRLFASCAEAAKYVCTVHVVVCASSAAAIKFVNIIGGAKLAQNVAALRYASTVDSVIIVSNAAVLQFVVTILGKTGARFAWKRSSQNMRLR
jgi:hypothetical protein